MANDNPYIQIMREIDSKSKQKGEQEDLLTSASNPWAFPSGRAGCPPTSIQLWRMSISSSSLVSGLLSSSLEASRKERGDSKNEAQE